MKSTAIANSNIAFIKYWGKKDLERNIPLNSSLSMTLSNVSTRTTIEFSKKYDKDIFILNNEKQSGIKLERVVNFISLVRKIARINLKAKVVSKNNFPTSSGLASSASAFAALAATSTKALGLKFSLRELSALARLGSGSAARSIYGGFVYWQSEYAIQLYDNNYWPELKDIIFIVSSDEKEISSREAMLLTQKKSRLFKKRLKEIPERIDKIKKSLAEKNFQELARIIMLDSDDMHSCINEIGINYLNKKSEKIKKIINKINKKEIVAAYTFDAGPNAHIITLSTHVQEIINKIKPITENIIINSSGEGISYSDEHLF